MNKIERSNVEVALAVLSRAHSIKAYHDTQGAKVTPYADIRVAMDYLELALNGENK